jgi:predicted AlkP superfamily phosphohydrolase/phosphomutase
VHPAYDRRFGIQRAGRRDQVAERKLLAIGLDGVDIGYAERLMDAGALPALAALRDRSATFLLEHGPAVRTGLAWEHFASGLTPEHAHRTSMVEFVGTEYDARQRGARFAPFFSSADARIVVFDVPYTDIARAPGVDGIVSWGAHDPGVTTTASPPELQQELDDRFGPYPSSKWTYARPWPSATRTLETGAALTRGLDVRREAAVWLLNERFPDWDLALVVAGEPHSASEAFWHGVDQSHPLHDRPSAPPAQEALEGVYRAADRLVDELLARTEPHAVVVFSLGGMGTNDSDTASMVLLPELVYRWSTGRQLLDVPRAWQDDPARVPDVDDADDPLDSVAPYYASPPRSLTSRIAAKLGGRPSSGARSGTPGEFDHALDWMPATRYRSQWRSMRAFALPAYYDGRIRVNLRGREPDGIVALTDYARTLDELEALLLACRDPRTGEPVVDHFERPGDPDPFALDPSDADLVVVWHGPSCAFTHPDLGLVGPAPFVRAGGHTGPYGFAYVSGDGIEPGDGGVKSAFDVAPTIAAMLDFTPETAIDGTSMLATRVI